MLDTLINLDTQLLLAINGAHNEFWDTFMYVYSGKIVWIPMYAALFYVLVRNLTLRQLIFCSIGVAVVILLADQVCSHLIRPYVERWRPSRLESPINELVHIVNGKRGGRYGFPSCHASNTFALATYFFLLLRRRWLACFLVVWALVTCYSRAYLGVHYPGDLLVGAMVGAVCAALVWYLLKRFAGYSTPRTGKHTCLPVLVGSVTMAGIAVYSGILLL